MAKDWRTPGHRAYDAAREVHGVARVRLPRWFDLPESDREAWERGLARVPLSPAADDSARRFEAGQVFEDEHMRTLDGVRNREPEPTEDPEVVIGIQALKDQMATAALDAARDHSERNRVHYSRETLDNFNAHADRIMSELSADDSAQRFEAQAHAFAVTSGEQRATILALAKALVREMER